MKDYFSYNNGSGQIPEGSFKISPSQLSRFFDETYQWWSEFAYNETPVFNGNTATELGTCVHAALAMYFDNGEVDHDAIENYINSIPRIDVDKNVIRNQWEIMAYNVIDAFLNDNKGTESEQYVSYEIIPGIYVAGSIDMYDERRETIVDYKTMGDLSSARVPTKFSRPYYFQQLTYAWIMRKLGKPVKQLKLVYVSRDNCGRVSETTGKPLKNYPSEVNVVSHMITDADMDLIDGVLNLVAESYKVWKENPELRHIITQDARRKEKPKPILFK